MRQQDPDQHKGQGLRKLLKRGPGIMPYRAGAYAMTCADKASRKRTVADTVS